MAFPRDVSLPVLSRASKVFKQRSASTKAAASGGVGNGNFSTWNT